MKNKTTTEEQETFQHFIDGRMENITIVLNIKEEKKSIVKYHDFVANEQKRTLKPKYSDEDRLS